MSTPRLRVSFAGNDTDTRGFTIGASVFAYSMIISLLRRLIWKHSAMNTVWLDHKLRTRQGGQGLVARALHHAPSRAARPHLVDTASCADKNQTTTQERKEEVDRTTRRICIHLCAAARCHQYQTTVRVLAWRFFEMVSRHVLGTIAWKSMSRVEIPWRWSHVG